MNIKHVAIAVLSLGASLPVLADDQKSANLQQGYAPPLNLIMVATQLSHFKLWYAGTAQNWPLANYELVQIRTSIDRARSLYPNNVQSNMMMMTPVADEVENAIKAKDSVKFSKAFSKLTAACNTCHEATGFGFIKMKIRHCRRSRRRRSAMSRSQVTSYSLSLHGYLYCLSRHRCADRAGPRSVRLQA